MAQVAIHADDLSADCLPAICVVTGEQEGVQARKVRWVWVNPLWYLLLLVGPGLLLLLIIYFAAARKAPGTLPFSDKGYFTWHRGRWTMMGAFILGILGFLPAIIAGGTLGLVLFVLALGSIVFSLVATRIWKGPRCLRIERDRLVKLDIPSAAAAEAIRQRLNGAAPAGALCANHAQLRAIGVCVRCGTFGCASCLSRSSEKAARRCAACRALIAKSR